MGSRANTGKPRVSLVPLGMLEEVARVSEFGAMKYGLDNWKKGLYFRDCVDSSLRHILSFLDGEDLDGESGEAHLAHAIWNLSVILHFQRQMAKGANLKHLDDR